MSTATSVASTLRIALIGSRGIPANYGGYETFLAELAPRLVRKGHQVTVYCRAHHTPRDLRQVDGVRLVVLPTIRSKYLDTPVHTLLSCLDSWKRSYDAALVVNSANAVFVPLLRFSGTPTALHVDGIEKQRAKWGWLGRTVYSLSERLACQLPNLLVTDARVIDEHYRQRYGRDSWMIVYGSEPRPPEHCGVLAELGLKAGDYFLYVSRFEPENNPHRVVEAYRQVGGELPLVMVGDAPYAEAFIAQVRAAADSRVLFPGAIYGDGYRELQQGALAYIHATEVGGTHPALVEAMGYGNCVLVNDAPENREVAGDSALYFRATEPTTLADHLEQVRSDPEHARQLGRQAGDRATRLFSWDAVCDRYEKLFTCLAGSTPEMES